MTQRSQKYRSGEARQAAILRAANLLFEARGYDRTTVEEIGSRAGISGPGVYRHFASKKEILDQLVQGALARHEELLREAREIADPDERVAHVAERLIRLSMDNRYAMASYRSYRLDLNDPTGATDPWRVLTRVWSRFIAEMNPGADGEECRAVVLILGGLVQGAMNASDRLDPERVIALTVPLVVDVLRGRTLSRHATPATRWGSQGAGAGGANC